MTAQEIQIRQAVADTVEAVLGDQISQLMEEVRGLKEMIAAQVAVAPGRKIKTTADICRDFGFSHNTLRTSPWLMPNFGLSDFPGKNRRWKVETYQNWFLVPGDARRREWDRMDIRKKAAIKAGNK